MYLTRPHCELYVYGRPLVNILQFSRIYWQALGA